MKGGLLTLQNRWPNTSYRHWFLGDWALPNEEYQLEEKSIDNVNNCAISWLYDTLSKIAGILNKPVDSKNYADRRDQLNQLIQEHYYNKEKYIKDKYVKNLIEIPYEDSLNYEKLAKKLVAADRTNPKGMLPSTITKTRRSINAKLSKYLG